MPTQAKSKCNAAPDDHSAGACEIITNNERARAFVQTWLNGTGLVWPGPFQISVQVGGLNPFPRDEREIFRQHLLTVQGGPPYGAAHIIWELEPAAAQVHESRPEAVIWLSEQALEAAAAGERTFFLVVLVFLMRRLGWYHIHGATFVDHRGRGWLMPGDSNCGKSTTTALVASRGWTVGTDDIGFLCSEGDKIVSRGVRSTIGLRPGGVALLGANGGTSLHERNKHGYWPEELGGSWTPRVTPEIIVFPRLGETTAVVRASPRHALSSVVMWSIWVLCEPQFAQEHLDVLGQVLRQSRCFDLTLGPDLFAHPNLLEDLIS